MSFESLMNDKIDILKQNGTRYSGLSASVQSKNIFMDHNGILVEPNDLIFRKMSNGAEETFTVIDPGFHEKFFEIEAGYQMTVQKLGLPEASVAVRNITFHISGNNARVNQNSIDNSLNIVRPEYDIAQHIEVLKKEIKQANISEIEKADALEVIDEIHDAFKSGNPKKSIVGALLKALPHAANVATIASAITSMLSAQ
jgi:hypothetical protein